MCQYTGTLVYEGKTKQNKPNTGKLSSQKEAKFGHELTKIDPRRAPNNERRGVRIYKLGGKRLNKSGGEKMINSVMTQRDSVPVTRG